jgi:hypothetical protein
MPSTQPYYILHPATVLEHMNKTTIKKETSSAHTDNQKTRTRPIRIKRCAHKEKKDKNGRQQDRQTDGGEGEGSPKKRRQKKKRPRERDGKKLPHNKQ